MKHLLSTKTKQRKILFNPSAFTSIIAIVVACAACSPESKSAKSSSLQKIQAETGIQLPKSARLLTEREDSRSADYYQWTLFAEDPTGIMMPYIAESNTGHYVTNDLKTALAVFEQETKTNITNPHLAFSSHWHKGDYWFRGTILQTENGEYLFLERFFRIVDGKVEQKPLPEK